MGLSATPTLLKSQACHDTTQVFADRAIYTAATVFMTSADLPVSVCSNKTNTICQQSNMAVHKHKSKASKITFKNHIARSECTNVGQRVQS